MSKVIVRQVITPGVRIEIPCWINNWNQHESSPQLSNRIGCSLHDDHLGLEYSQPSISQLLSCNRPILPYTCLEVKTISIITEIAQCKALEKVTYSTWWKRRNQLVWYDMHHKTMYVMRLGALALAILSRREVRVNVVCQGRPVLRWLSTDNCSNPLSAKNSPKVRTLTSSL